MSPQRSGKSTRRRLSRCPGAQALAGLVTRCTQRQAYVLSFTAAAVLSYACR